MKLFTLVLTFLLFSSQATAWEAKVTSVLQHRDWVAVNLVPDPGVGACTAGNPYLIAVDGAPQNDQLFTMVMTALNTGKTVEGFASDPCSSAIWGQPRPKIERLRLKN